MTRHHSRARRSAGSARKQTESDQACADGRAPVGSAPTAVLWEGPGAASFHLSPAGWCVVVIAACAVVSAVAHCL